MNTIKSWAVRSVFRLLSLLSLSSMSRLGRLLGTCLWLINGKVRQVTEKNLAICLTDMSIEQRKTLAKKSLQHLGIISFELGASWQWPVDKLLKTVVAVDGLEIMEEARRKDKGTIVLVPHIGNWEVLGLYLAQNYQLTTLYQPPTFQSLDQIIVTARSRNGANLVPTNTNGVKALLKALKRGEETIILPDQVPPKGSGEYAPFFNIPTLTATLAQNLVQRTGASIVIAAMLRLDDGKGFRVIFQAVDDSVYSQDSLIALTALNKSVENIVLEAPEQYQWEYKRFRRVAPGYTQPYK